MGRIQHTLNGDIPVLRLSHGACEADICPGIGANCIRFARQDINVLRTPPGYEAFQASPNVYGTPLLFPPNRIAGGLYTFRGKTYRLPINEPARGHFIHGSLSRAAFALSASSADDTEASAAFTADFDEGEPYPFFPYGFTVTLSYRLNAEGLTQTLSLANRSREAMPVGLGFHTTFALPFLPDTREEDYRLCAAVGPEICLNPETIIPTGAYKPDSAVGSALSNGSLCPACGALSNHFQGLTGDITLTHLPSGTSVCYTPDAKFSFLMLWNGGGHSGFVCPEPQTWQVDAPNSPLPPETTGFQALAPGEAISFTNRFSIALND